MCGVMFVFCVSIRPSEVQWSELWAGAWNINLWMLVLSKGVYGSGWQLFHFSFELIVQGLVSCVHQSPYRAVSQVDV